MSEHDKKPTGIESDPEVEAHLLKEALAAGAATAAVFAGTAQAHWMPVPGGSQAVVMPGPGAEGSVDPGPGSGTGAAVDPGGGGAGQAVELTPDAVDRYVANMNASKASKAKQTGKPAKKAPLVPGE